MKSYRKELVMNIPARRGFVNITPQVNACLRESGISEGLVLVMMMKPVYMRIMNAGWNTWHRMPRPVNTCTTAPGRIMRMHISSGRSWDVKWWLQ